jgi:heme/copper-type cytochrome/quinol oxidase subunit 2
MAEIKIEKKKPVWPWIVALVLIAALVYFVFLRDNEGEYTNEDSIENNTTLENTSDTDTLQLN